MFIRRIVCFSVLLTLAPAFAADAPVEKLPPGTKIVSLAVSPAGTLELRGKFDYAQLLIEAINDKNERIDVTRIAAREIAGENPAAIQLTAGGWIRPVQDGAAELKLSLEGVSLVVPIRVAELAQTVHPDFIRDVNPVMTKLGCNQGTCHGGAQGKNGFKLSLRGYDPIFDYRALTDDLMGRRFNRVMPDQSLMLLKPSGAVPHVGGVLCKPGEPYYEILRAWIADGLPFDPKAARVTKLEILPQNPVIPLPGMKQQFRVVATYADQRVRDVTAEAFVESGNIEVLEADRSGIVTSLRRGESPVLVRFEGNYAATTVTVMGDRTGFAWSNPPTYNHIDELVYAKLRKVRVLPSDVCKDDEFLRRVSLDLTGLPPTAAQTRAFLADARDSRVKRDELIERLVGSGEFVEHWTNKWSDMLQVNGKFLGEQGAVAMRHWIRQNVASNTPYDKFVYDVLTARGSTVAQPAAGYFKTLREPDVVMENTTQLFLGVRFSCNKCHDHPFERWTQDQHWRLAAYFAKVQRKEDPQYAGQKIGGSAVEGAVPLVEVVYDGPGGDVKHPNSGQTMTPGLPYQEQLVGAASRGVLRDEFAQWATSAENQYFAKSYVNRVWSYLLGVGFIEPVDDIRAGNPPTNPELLDRLTKDFIANGFDTQKLIKEICKSRVYQHALTANRWNEDDAINYSHALARRLPAEVLFDAVHQATGSVRHLSGLPAGSRAALQRDPTTNSPDGFLDLFGRPARESSCECERATGVMLGQTLNLVTGPTVAAAISDPNSALTKLIKEQPDDAKLVEELFLRFLNRYPTEKEIVKGVAALRTVDDAHAEQVERLKSYEAQLPQKIAAWEKTFAPTSWSAPLEMLDAKSTAGAKFVKGADGAIWVEGPLDKDRYTVTFDVDAARASGIRIEALTDDRLPAKGPGRAPNGNFVLSELALSVAPSDALYKSVPLKLRGGEADFAQADFPAKYAVDGNPDTGWAVSPEFGKSHTAIFEIAEWPVAGKVRLTTTLNFQFHDGKHNLGKFRISLAEGPGRPSLQGPPPELAAILKTPAADRTPEQRAELERRYAAGDAELQSLRASVAVSAKAAADPRLMGAQDLVWALINTPSFLFNR